MPKKLITWLSIICFSFCYGCAHYHYQDDLFKCPVLPSAIKINKAIGMNELLDNRPNDEKGYFPPDNLCNKFQAENQTVSKRITEVLLKNFQESGLFKEIHFSVQPQDNYVINGSIERLVMKSKSTFWTSNPLVGIFPPLQFPVLFGVAFNQQYCIVDISLEVRNNQTNTITASIRASSRVVLNMSIYDSEAGKDVTEAFCNVVNQLKKELSEKIK